MDDSPLLRGRRVTLRSLAVDDFAVWQEVRHRNSDWLNAWEPRRPPSQADPARDRKAFVARCASRRRERQLGTGYGSRQWIVDFVKNPEHEKFYPDNNDRMPAFGVKKILTDKEIGLIADWLRGDYFELPADAQGH